MRPARGGPPPSLVVGHVVKPHGLRGEVVVRLVTNRLERLTVGTRLACSRATAREPNPAPGHAERPGTGSLPDELEVIESRPHQGRHLVRFAGVQTIEAAEDLRGAELSAPPIEDPEAMFVHELIGCTVVDVDGVARGTVVAVESNPASDLLVLDDRHLVPLRFVVGRGPGQLVVDAPDGLFD